ncbi:MAG: cobyric acid synthase [Thermodesulfobacteriota bacterium]|nr:cobyric acid synthase [Thermodesulfobacteriota bacterium]
MDFKEENKKAPCIAVFGTGSDVGKSIISTALCRFLKNKGINVAPFKAQNMSNNSGVTPEGLEMGRAQIVQAEAAGIPPHVDMNPILLKPTSDIGSQIILFGKAAGNKQASEYHTKKEHLFVNVCEAVDRLRGKYDVVVLEGAGSCAEVNLMPNDMVNFSMAEYTDASVILVADIHKGGVFGQIIGTLECLSPQQQKRITGFIINRFKGDMALFEDGISWIENKTGKKVFGVLPWYNHINIEAEDSVIIENPQSIGMTSDSPPSIAVLRIPHISNFTDFDPISRLPGVNLHFVEKPQELAGFKAIIIPGSKNTRFDLTWLKKTGWWEKILSYINHGGHMLGICGGYQMMGKYVHDPDGLEGKPGTTKGLSLLPVETILKAPKITTLTRFCWDDMDGIAYEIHMGQTEIKKGDSMFQVFQRNNVSCNCKDGCVVGGFRIMGTYMHGLFENPGITKRWLETIGLGKVEVSQDHGPAARNKEYDLLCEHFEKYIDTKGITESIISQVNE